MEAEPTNAESTKRKRRWFQFSLRTTMVAVTLLCVWLGVVCNRANRQRRAVEVLRKSGALVWYGYEFEIDENGESRPPGPDWLRNLIGVDYFAAPTEVGMPEEFDISDEFLVALADLPQVTGVGLRGGGVNDVVAAKLSGLTQLQSLGISGASITDAGWEFLKHLPHLKKLDLIGLDVSDSTLCHIKDLSNLTHVDLLDIQVTDSGLQYLQGLSQLEWLRLQEKNPMLTDAGLQHLNTLRHLKYLNIIGGKVTASGVADLKRTLPALTVSLTGSGL
jgi:hypothetical protein